MKLSIGIIEDRLMGLEWRFYYHPDDRHKALLSKSYKWFSQMAELTNELRFIQLYIPKAQVYFEIEKSHEDKIFFDIEFNATYGYCWRLLRKSTEREGDVLMSKCSKWFPTMTECIEELQVLKMYLPYTEIDFKTVKTSERNG
jgi:hypothetical protein